VYDELRVKAPVVKLCFKTYCIQDYLKAIVWRNW